MNITEMRNKRKKLIETMDGFLETHQHDGSLSAEDDATYREMENTINTLTSDIHRMERRAEIEAELEKPVGKPITEKPAAGMNAENEAKIRKKEYNKSFWNVMRKKLVNPEVMNALQEGTDSEGGYLVPDEFEHTLVEALESENIFRKLAHIINTSSGDRKIPVVASKGTASWVDEEGSIT